MIDLTAALANKYRESLELLDLLVDSIPDTVSILGSKSRGFDGQATQNAGTSPIGRSMEAHF